MFWFVLLENPHADKIPRFRGGWVFFWRGGGGSANFIFMGAGIFLTLKDLLFPKRRNNLKETDAPFPGQKRRFEKWHLFHAYAAQPPPLPGLPVNPPPLLFRLRWAANIHHLM